MLRGAFGLIFLGLLIGAPLAVVAERFLRHQLEAAQPFDPIMLIVAVLALVLPAFAASLIPALRASLISPIDALRHE